MTKKTPKHHFGGLSLGMEVFHSDRKFLPITSPQVQRSSVEPLKDSEVFRPRLVLLTNTRHLSESVELERSARTSLEGR